MHASLAPQRPPWLPGLRSRLLAAQLLFLVCRTLHPEQAGLVRVKSQRPAQRRRYVCNIRRFSSVESCGRKRAYRRPGSAR
jgi:hypothetical protein